MPTALRQPSARRTRAALLAALFSIPAVIAASCSSSSDPLASATIGPAGGTVEVTVGGLAGASIVIPPGALNADVLIQIYQSVQSDAPNVTVVGLAAEFTPQGTLLATPATVSLPYDPSLVPSGTTEEDFVIGLRSVTGMVEFRVPTSVDLVAGTLGTMPFGSTYPKATFEALQLGTAWVAVETSDLIDTAAYLPLQDSDSYVYSNNSTLFLAAVTNEPNLQGYQVIKANLAFAGSDYQGVYLRRESGATVSFGAYDGQSVQQVNDSPMLWLPATAKLGMPTVSSVDYVGYEPYGSPVPAYTGSLTTTTTIVSQGSVTTPLKTFTDAIQVSRVTEWKNSTGASGMTTDVIWYANGVGPVVMDLEGRLQARLTSAIVGGDPVLP